MYTTSFAIFSGLLALSTQLVNAYPQHPNSTSKWSTLPSIPIAPRQEHVTLSTGSKIVIIGGIIQDGSNVTTIPLVQAYDIASQTWSQLASIPIPLNHANAAVVNGKIYVLGGLALDTDGAWRQTSDAAFVYDEDADEWHTLGSIPPVHSRGSAAVAVHGTTVYLAGGLEVLSTVPPYQQETVAVVSAYDTLTDTWHDLPTAAAALPEGRGHAGSSIVGNNFLVLGGRAFGQENVKDTVFALNVTNPAAGWKTRRGRMPTPRGGLSSGTIGTKVYTFGGEGNPAEGSNGVFNNTEVYDAVKDTWKKLEPMAIPVHGTYAVGVGKKVYIPGGGVIISGGGLIDTFQLFRP